MKTHHIISLALALTATAFAQTKVSDRPSLSSGSLAPATDILPIVDVSAGTTGSKKITIDNLFTGWGFTSAGATVAKAADASAQRTALGLVIGTDVQAWDTDLTTWAGKTAPSGTVVGTSDTQTLTAKTLTSPVINVTSDATGDIYYRSSGGAFSRLGIGSTGQVLTVASGLPSWAAAGGAGLVNLVESISTSSPNATIPSVRLLASNAATHVDLVLSPKGTSGALMAHRADNTSTGGNKRGARAVDWQMTRDVADAVASGAKSVISGGESNIASGAGSVVSGGVYNWADGDNAVVPGGLENYASGDYSTAAGLRSDARSLYGADVRASGFFSLAGDAQVGRYTVRRFTTDATQSELTLDGSSPGAATRIVLPNQSTYSFTGQISARSSGGDAAAWRFSGTIERGAAAANTAIIGTVTMTDTQAEAGASTWAVVIDADTTNGSLRLRVTGVAATNIRWLAVVETCEVVY